MTVRTIVPTVAPVIILLMRSLLNRRLGQSFAIVFVFIVEKARAGLFEPSIADYALERASFAVDGPGLLIVQREVAKLAAAHPAGKNQPRAASGGPIEHLYLEIMAIPGITIKGHPYFTCVSLVGSAAIWLAGG